MQPFKLDRFNPYISEFQDSLVSIAIIKLEKNFTSNSATLEVHKFFENICRNNRIECQNSCFSTTMRKSKVYKFCHYLDVERIVRPNSKIVDSTLN